MSEWATRPLGELLELVIDHRGKTPNKMGFDDFDDSGYPVLSAKHVKTDELVNLDSIRFANEQMYRKWMKVETQEGDVVLTSEAPMGEVFYLDGKTKYLLGQRVFGLRPIKELIDPLYLAAWLTSRNGQEQLVARASGSTVLGIKQSELLKVEVDLPPMEVQSQIAKHRYDLSKKIELNRQINRTLEEMAQAIFKSWFVDFDPVKAKMEAIENGEDPERAAMRAISGKSDEELDALPCDQFDQLAATAARFPSSLTDSPLGPIPEGWSTIPLYQTAEYVNGAAFKASDFSNGEGLPIVKIAELKQGLAASTKFTTNKYKGKYAIDNGDVLYSWSGSPETSLEVFKWFGGKGWLNQHIFKLNFSSKEQQCFTYYLLQHMKPVLIATAQQKQTTGLGHITVADMKRLLVAYPTGPLLTEFMEKVSPLYEHHSSLTQQNDLLATARDLLLPKLLSGEISVGATKDKIEAIA